MAAAAAEYRLLLRLRCAVPQIGPTDGWAGLGHKRSTAVLCPTLPSRPPGGAPAAREERTRRQCGLSLPRFAPFRCPDSPAGTLPCSLGALPGGCVHAPLGPIGSASVLRLKAAQRRCRRCRVRLLAGRLAGQNARGAVHRLRKRLEGIATRHGQPDARTCRTAAPFQLAIW